MTRLLVELLTVLLATAIFLFVAAGLLWVFGIAAFAVLALLSPCIVRGFFEGKRKAEHSKPKV